MLTSFLEKLLYGEQVTELHDANRDTNIFDETVTDPKNKVQLKQLVKYILENGTILFIRKCLYQQLMKLWFPRAAQWSIQVFLHFRNKILFISLNKKKCISGAQACQIMIWSKMALEWVVTSMKTRFRNSPKTA